MGHGRPRISRDPDGNAMGNRDTDGGWRERPGGPQEPREWRVGDEGG